MSSERLGQSTFQHNNKTYSYIDLDALNPAFKKVPRSLKILLENILRHETDPSKAKQFMDYVLNRPSHTQDMAFRPSRVLMQDFTGVPAVVDLSAMRDAMKEQGGDPSKINPQIPVDLVIDHSVMVDRFGTQDAFSYNVHKEYERNKERYEFLKWAQKSFENFRVVPPGTGICHQVNIEYLAPVMFEGERDGTLWAYPDTVVGTDSHTTMVNGLSVLGWGVGGIEAEAAMLGQSISMLIPEVVGVNLTGALKEGVTATDLVLTITHILRSKGVVGKFVEFYGEGLGHLSLADRATISNMVPEYGATCGLFPIDDETLNYLRLTGRNEKHIDFVKTAAEKMGLWRSDDLDIGDSITLDLGSILPSLAGPKRPQDKILLSDIKSASESLNKDMSEKPINNHDFTLSNHDVVIAAITSCTNTSNPSVMIGAGLVAKKAKKLGLNRKPWVKTSLAPGSQAVTEYLKKSGLLKDLEDIGFNLVGYGCTTCIGNSGPLDTDIAKTIEDHHLDVSGVLSGNRNFEGRISPHVTQNYLASPPLVVMFALAGTTNINFDTDPIGTSKDGKDIYFRDLWPSSHEIKECMNASISQETFTQKYKSVFAGDGEWQKIDVSKSDTYSWPKGSTYIQKPPYISKDFENSLDNIENARILALLGDSITTDHISPAGIIKTDGPAGDYLTSNGVDAADFNSFGSRRGNHEVMIRGTFANIRLQNKMAEGKTGGYTKHDGNLTTIYEASEKSIAANQPLVVFAGKEYGTGSSRDWAAKGTRLLGVKAVLALSFERIHRSNLVGMGVLPLELPIDFYDKVTLIGDETMTISGLESGLEPRKPMGLLIKTPKGDETKVPLICRLDTKEEIDYYLKGGILPYVLNNLKNS